MVNLQEMKNYLRIDHYEEDEMIQDLIQTAIIYIDECCGTGYKSIESKNKLADILIKKIVADMYSNREGITDKKVQDRKVTTILELLSGGNQ